jgi:hypothetical protein
MAKHPSLSDRTFLGHLFSPKRNPKPTGLRKTSLTGLRGGRNKARLAAYNRMDPVKQELLKRAGMRDQYLRGEATLAEAKRALRPQAIQLGVAKPVRRRGPIQVVIRTPLDARVAAHLKYVIRSENKPLNPFAVDRNVGFIPDDVLPDVETWDYGQIKWAARTGSEYETVIDGHQSNPFWYH